jgi:RimJ/RimL family protein N-acetyltransferase
MQIELDKLSGKYVYLELLQPEHVPELARLARDERIWEYTKTLITDERFDGLFEKYIAAALDEKNTGMQVSFVMRDPADGSIMGMTRFYKIEPPHKRLSIGFTWYLPKYWGGVQNKECKLLLLQYAFETLGYQRVEFEVAHQNLRSQKAVQKIGGVPEGRLRKHGLHADGTVRDTMVFSIVDDEWQEKKQKLLAMIRETEKINI